MPRRFSLLILASTLAAHVHAENPELAQLAREDQAARMAPQLDHRDAERRQRVLRILAAGQPVDPRDRLNAALVLQHTGLAMCDGALRSESAENYLLAHYLAMSAFEAGEQDAATLVAQTIDRYLTFTEGRQKYGTNRLVDQETGEEYLPPIDRTVTDAERKRFGVPALQALLARYKERPSVTSP